MTKKICVLNAAITNVGTQRLATEDRVRTILGIGDKKIPDAIRPVLQQEVLPKAVPQPAEMRRKRLRDFMDKVAVKDPLIGYIIPPEMAESVHQQLLSMQREFEADKQLMLSQYPQLCANHLDEVLAECQKVDEFQGACGAFIDLVCGLQPSAAYVERKVQFSILKPRMIDLDPEEEGGILSSLYDKALEEVAKRADKADKSVLFKTKVDHLKALGLKMQAFAYINPNLEVLGKEVIALVEALPPLESGEDYATLHTMAIIGVISTLKDATTVGNRLDQGGHLFPGLDIDRLREVGAIEKGAVKSAPAPAPSDTASDQDLKDEGEGGEMDEPVAAREEVGSGALDLDIEAAVAAAMSKTPFDKESEMTESEVSSVDELTAAKPASQPAAPGPGAFAW